MLLDIFRGEIDQIKVDFKTRIVNNASDHCPLTEYKIGRIVDANTGMDVSDIEFKNSISMTKDGVFTHDPINKDFKYLVYFIAYNLKSAFLDTSPAILIQSQSEKF